MPKKRPRRRRETQRLRAHRKQVLEKRRARVRAQRRGDAEGEIATYGISPVATGLGVLANMMALFDAQVKSLLGVQRRKKGG